MGMQWVVDGGGVGVAGSRVVWGNGGVKSTNPQSILTFAIKITAESHSVDMRPVSFCCC